MGEVEGGYGPAHRQITNTAELAGEIDMQVADRRDTNEENAKVSHLSEMVLMGKNVTLELFRIFNDNTGDDPGNSLEIFGHLEARQERFLPDIGSNVPVRTVVLLDRSSDHYKDVVQGESMEIDSSAIFTLEPSDSVVLSGEVWDQDTFGPDDRLGGVDMRWGFSDAQTGAFDVKFLDGGGDQAARAQFALVVS